jgi:2'-5' RNA ligase
MSTEKVYFVAILPDETLQNEVTAFKKYAAEHFNTKRALTSPPHITLQPPFRWNEHNLHPIRVTLKKVCESHSSFEVSLKNFNSFFPRVIFVDVELSDNLNWLHQNLQSQMKEQHRLEDRFDGFHPHMTVAFKDLKKKIFPDAWKYFSKLKYEKTFMVHQLILLVHNGENWEILESFKLAG